MSLKCQVHRRHSSNHALVGTQATILLDRDGVLNLRPPKSEYIRRWEEFCWIPGAKEALRLLREADYDVLVITNQAGIGRGLLTEADLAAIHDNMLSEVSAAGGEISAIYYCPHRPEQGCPCRKPKPEMLRQAQQDCGFDLENTLFVGDEDTDKQAAIAAGCMWKIVSSRLTLLDVTRQLLQLSKPRLSM